MADALSRALPPGAAAQQPVDLTVGVGFYKAGTTELDHVMRQMVPRRCHPLVKEVNWDWEATALSHALEYAGYDEFQEALDLNYTTAQAVWGQAAAISLRDDLRRSYLTGVRGASGADEALRGTGDCGRRVREPPPLSSHQLPHDRCRSGGGGLGRHHRPPRARGGEDTDMRGMWTRGA